MHTIAICIHFATICLLTVSDLFLFVTIAYAFLVTQWFVLLLLAIIHVLDL